MSEGLEILRDIGFEFVGDWKIENRLLSFNLSQYSSLSNVLYAFVANSQVMYIGKTDRTIQERLNGVKRPGPTQRTNIKNNKNIFSMLSKGIRVEIFVFAEKPDLKYRSIPIDVASGIEGNLIALIEPEWNDMGKKDILQL